MTDDKKESDNTPAVERRRKRQSAEDRSLVDSNDQTLETVKIERRRRHSSRYTGGSRFKALLKYVTPGYVPRLVDPKLDRPQMFEENDWEFCKDENGKVVTLTINHSKFAESHQFVLMQIRKEWYDEDQAEKKRDRQERLNDSPLLTAAEKAQFANKSELGYSKDKL